MQQITFYILVFGLLSCSSNNENKFEVLDKDTLIVHSSDSSKTESEQIIIPRGTQVLPNSAKTGIFNELSPWFLKTVNFTECQNSGESPDYSEHNKLQETIKTDSTISLNFTFVATCGSDFLCEVEFVNNDGVNLIYHQYNSNTMCRCCYGLEFVFGIHGYYDPEFYEQLDYLPEIKFVSFNGSGKVRLDL